MAIGGDPPPRALLGRALNGHSAEFCVLVTDFASFPIISSITPSFCLFEAIPFLYGNAGRWRRALK